MKNIGIATLCLILTGCVESRFELAPDSRLPAWFSLPSGFTRDDVTVTLTYFTTAPAEFVLRDRSGHVLSTVAAEPCTHPDTLQKRNANGGYELDSYPHYYYFVNRGVLELIEHRRPEPRFRISDDGVLREAAIELGKCLHNVS